MAEERSLERERRMKEEEAIKVQAKREKKG